jgi:hypothetical protein
VRKEVDDRRARRVWTTSEDEDDWTTSEDEDDGVLLPRNLKLRTHIGRSMLFRHMCHNHWVVYPTIFFI